MPTGSSTSKMALKEVLAALEKAGTAQNRKVYARHGMDPEAMYGVSFAQLGALAKKIKVDHGLAMGLWKTGNHDARMLATMIADPGALAAADLNEMAREVDNYCLCNALAGLAAKTEHAAACARKWTGLKPSARNEFHQRTGFDVVSAHLSARRKSPPDEATDLPDAFLKSLIGQIERDIHSAPNRTREGMNTCLISIGSYRESLREEALAAAERIGVVEVDHGETGCKTPFAPEYIRKTAAHNDRLRSRSRAVAKGPNPSGPKRAARKPASRR